MSCSGRRACSYSNSFYRFRPRVTHCLLWIFSDSVRPNYKLTLFLPLTLVEIVAISSVVSLSFKARPGAPTRLSIKFGTSSFPLLRTLSPFKSLILH